MATALKISLKSEFVLLQIIRAYSFSFSLSNVGNFFLELKFEVQEKKKKVFVLSSRSPQNVKFSIFTS